MTLQIIFALLLIHFLADQILQVPLVQKGKNDSALLMAAHVTTWALWMIPVCFWIMINMTHDFTPFLWWIIASTSHFIADYLMSFWINALIKKKYLHYAIYAIHLNALIVHVVIIKAFFVIVIWS